LKDLDFVNEKLEGIKNAILLLFIMTDTPTMTYPKPRVSKKEPYQSFLTNLSSMVMISLMKEHLIIASKP